jgi:hypothetical protein
VTFEAAINQRGSPVLHDRLVDAARALFAVRLKCCGRVDELLSHVDRAFAILLGNARGFIEELQNCLARGIETISVGRVSGCGHSHGLLLIRFNRHLPQAKLWRLASHQLRAAENRIAELEAEAATCQNQAERAEQWLHKVYTEIEDRFPHRAQALRGAPQR